MQSEERTYNEDLGQTPSGVQGQTAWLGAKRQSVLKLNAFRICTTRGVGQFVLNLLFSCRTQIFVGRSGSFSLTPAFAGV